MMVPEFFRPVEVARLGAAEAVYDIAATETECAALAQRFGLLSLDRFTARISLLRIVDGKVRMAASLSADLTQACIVTLDPVASHVEDSFTLLFAAAADDATALDPDADPVEPLVVGRIDLGEAVAQQLSLAIDPFPRSPGARA
jgi:uncharacterized metal-binding protein YceD (DUF177 family)